MKLSGRLMMLIFGMALPALLVVAIIGYWLSTKAFEHYVNRQQATEIGHVQQQLTNRLHQSRDTLLVIRNALESDSSVAQDFLISQLDPAKLSVFVVNHHVELHPLTPEQKQPNGSQDALSDLVKPVLADHSLQLERIGFMKIKHQLFGLVSIPVKHRQWRALLGVQRFDDSVLQAVADDNSWIDRFEVQPLTRFMEPSRALPDFDDKALAVIPVFEQQSAANWQRELLTQLLIVLMLMGLLAIGLYMVGRSLLMVPVELFQQRLDSRVTNTRGSQTLFGEHSDLLGSIYPLCNDLLNQRHYFRQRSLALLRAVNDAVVVVDDKAKIELVNSAAERLLSMEHGPVHQFRLSDLISGEAGQELNSMLSDLLTSSRISHEGRQVIKQGKKEIALEFNATRIMDGDGKSLGAVLVLSDVTQSEEMRLELERKSRTDQITGLYNRHTFEQMLAALDEEKGQHAICYIDLNRFKLINDSCGHQAGDRMLRDVAMQLRSTLTGQEKLARIGGDEFAAIISNASALEVARMLKQLVERIEGLTLYFDSGSYQVGVSIGVAFLRDDNHTAKEVFKDSEIACQACKSKGGESHIHFFDSLDQDLAQERNAPQWAMRINDAIVNDDLVLFYQPIEPVLEQTTRRKCEVLLRIHEEDGKLLPPGQFIAAAERFNLMPQVDRAIIRKTFEWLARNPDLWDTQVLSINLSGTTLSNGGLVNYIDEMADLYRIPPETVCFEVTETAAIANETRALDILNSLRNKGYAFALDDFGSGFASYGYLRKLPVDYVKIDGCFVRNLATNPKDYAIVKSIHDVCRVMGIETVAEFVEDQETLARLRAIGVNYAQGYGVGRPKELEGYQPLVEKEMV